jgi:hypothetical protein
MFVVIQGDFGNLGIQNRKDLQGSKKTLAV